MQKRIGVIPYTGMKGQRAWFRNPKRIASWNKRKIQTVVGFAVLRPEVGGTITKPPGFETWKVIKFHLKYEGVYFWR